MISKQWQRTQKAISLSGLAFGVGLPFFLLETNFENWLKVLILAAGYVLVFPALYWLHKRYATTFVRVVRYDYITADRLIRRELGNQSIPFTRRFGDGQVTYQIRLGDMQLTVDEFMLNLPIDDHITPETATKLTLGTETAENAIFMEQIRALIDELFREPQTQRPILQPAYYENGTQPQGQQQDPIPVSQFTEPK